MTQTAADRAALRDRIAQLLRPHASLGGTPPQWELPYFDGATPSLPRIAGWKPLDDVVAALAAVLPAPTDRAAVLREAANSLACLGPEDSLVSGPTAWTEAVETLRRMADEAQPAQHQQDEALCQCGHGKAYHGVEYGTPRCRLCPERGEWKWDHAFTAAAEAQQDGARP